MKAVAGGLAEIGILSDAVESGGLLLRPFAIDRLVIAVARTHPLAGEKRIAFADLLDLAHVGLAADALQVHLEEQAARIGRKLKVRARVRTFEGLCRMAAHGVGVGVVPETAAQRLRRSLPIASLRLTDGWATRRLSVCCRCEADLAPPARALFDHLQHGGSSTIPRSKGAPP